MTVSAGDRLINFSFFEITRQITLFVRVGEGAAATRAALLEALPGISNHGLSTRPHISGLNVNRPVWRFTS